MDLVCVSHLRWDFVFQRPQHLLTRAARTRRVFYIEEPEFVDAAPSILSRSIAPSLTVAVPQVPRSASRAERLQIQADLIEQLLVEQSVSDYTLWLYTPMALEFTHQLTPTTVVYDCMDELSGFSGAPPELMALESDLFAWADVVFTGGHTLYEAKQGKHANVHAFPSSVDVEHFNRARGQGLEPEDQRAIPRPRIGYYGVIDERMDYELLAGVAASRPDWHLVLVGPTAKIAPDALPKAPNIHYLGGRSYTQLPEYISGWDVAMLPFARNEATRFISPTKTPEYLAAGLPVVSTSIRDVVRPYGELGLAYIADTVDQFVAAIGAALACDRAAHINAADDYLRHLSWDRTWTAMWEHVERVTERRLSRV
jgi:glycosyltransferase involved in cell wall biosynthesis